jgi:hypothetical protein
MHRGRGDRRELTSPVYKMLTADASLRYDISMFSRFQQIIFITIALSLIALAAYVFFASKIAS